VAVAAVRSAQDDFETERPDRRLGRPRTAASVRWRRPCLPRRRSSTSRRIRRARDVTPDATRFGLLAPQVPGPRAAPGMPRRVVAARLDTVERGDRDRRCVVRGTDRFGGDPQGRAGVGRGGRALIAIDRCCRRRPNARRLSGRRARDAGGTAARGGSSSASPHARRPPGERDRPRSSPTRRARPPPGGRGRRSDRRRDAPTAPCRRARAAGGGRDRIGARTRRRRGRGLGADACRCAADRRASRVADGSRDRARGRAAQRPRRADARAAPPRSPCRSPCAGARIGDLAGSSFSRRGVDPQSATTSEHGCPGRPGPRRR
jgi:hypothetical protein